MPLQKPRRPRRRPTPRPLRRVHRLPALPLPMQTCGGALPPPRPPPAQTTRHHSQNDLPHSGREDGHPRGPAAATGWGGRRRRRGCHEGLGPPRGSRGRWATMTPAVVGAPSPQTRPPRWRRARRGGLQRPPKSGDPMGGTLPSRWQAEGGGGGRGGEGGTEGRRDGGGSAQGL